MTGDIISAIEIGLIQVICRFVVSQPAPCRETDEVRQLIAEGAAELAENYDIDGLHFDDYFYPTTAEDFDAQCFSAQTEFDDLAKWRLNNISLMVGEIYSAVKAVDKDILVGVSPQGNMENNYEYMYADVKKWCSEEGYIDYICPQIYFGYENSVKPSGGWCQDL